MGHEPQWTGCRDQQPHQDHVGIEWHQVLVRGQCVPLEELLGVNPYLIATLTNGKWLDFFGHFKLEVMGNPSGLY